MPAINTIQVRRDTAANWTTANSTLAAGEIGFETNTGKFKIGTGAANWAALGYAVSGAVSAHAASHTNGGSDPVTLTQSQVTNLTTDLATKVEKTNGTVTTAATGSTVVRNITLSTVDPTGGADGDVWLKYTA